MSPRLPAPVGRTWTVDPDIVAVLAESTCAGETLALPRQLDPAVYRRVRKVIEAAEGRWDKRRGVHVFEQDALAAIEPILVVGTIRLPPELGWFPTPPKLAAELVRRAGVRPGWRVLEPSAGEGAIVCPLLSAGAEVHVHEIDDKRRAVLRELLRDPAPIRLGRCFMARDPEPVFRAVVMNPPFAPRTTDVHHVRHAFDFLEPGGRLVAVMSAGTVDRADRRTIDLRDLVHDLGGTIEPLPDGSFKPSGTAVRTVVVTVCKPKGKVHG